MNLRLDFFSDNTAGAAPEAIQALVAANGGSSAGYGEDAAGAQAADLVRALLDVDAEVRFVGSGTAANALSLAALCRPFEAVLAHEHAHILRAETGAPGFFGHGLGLIGLAGASARIDPEALHAALGEPDSAHHPSPAALSLTNATEYGALYGAEAIGVLTSAAKARGLRVHLDGARLANAFAAGLDPKAIKTLGVDILVLGGAKAGMPPTEAIVLLNGQLAHRFDARLKQAGQLASKGRFLSAPWIGMLASGAYLAHARHANAMARALAERMPFEHCPSVESNGVFVAMEAVTLARLEDRGWGVHRSADGSVRFMCSWATTLETVEELAAALRAIA